MYHTVTQSPAANPSSRIGSCTREVSDFPLGTIIGRHHLNKSVWPHFCPVRAVLVNRKWRGCQGQNVWDQVQSAKWSTTQAHRKRPDHQHQQIPPATFQPVLESFPRRDKALIATMGQLASYQYLVPVWDMGYNVNIVYFALLFCFGTSGQIRKMSYYNSLR